MVKGQRDMSIKVARLSYGFTLNEIADYLRIHYASVDKVVTKPAASKKRYFKTPIRFSLFASLESSSECALEGLFAPD